MAGFGYFLQGLAGGMQQAQERKRQAAEDAIRQDYLKSQKKILDAQIKSQEIEENWWNSQPEEAQKLRFLPKEMQSLAFMMSGMKGLPSLGGQKTPPPPVDLTGAMSTNQGTFVPSMGGAVSPEALNQAMNPPAEQGGGFGDVASNVMMRSLWKKMFGLDIGELHPRTVADPKTGEPITQFYDISGNPAGPAIREPVKREQMRIKGPTGEMTAWINPYAPQSLQAPTQTAPPEVETVTVEKGGTKYELDINKYSREPVGVPRIKEEMKGQEAEKAGKFTMAQNSLDELTSITSSFFNPDGTFNNTILAQAKVNLPFTKGRTVKQAFKRALETSIRIMSGAAVPETEVSRYLEMFMPDVLDTDEGARAKISSMYKFLNGLISQMDPTGQLQLRSVEARAKTLQTPTPFGQKNAPQVGTVQKGYRFKGGDPSQKENWEKVK